MVRFALIPLIWITHLHAIEGVVAVLEAPLFAIPNEQSKVIQYHRKGALIYIHSAGPHPESVDTSFFHKTIARNGKVAYVLKKHIILKTKDSQEFDQAMIEHDDTDYRLQEPLREGYPFFQKSGYKGLSQLAIGRSHFQAYPFTQNTEQTTANLSSEFSFIWSKLRKVESHSRFFFGVIFSFGTASIDYTLKAGEARQEQTRLGVGPLASYDLLRNKNYGLNIYFSIQAALIDKMDLTVQDTESGSSEQRAYNANFPFSGLLGMNYQFYKAFYVFDTVVGSNVRLNLPRNYQAQGTAKQTVLWNSTEQSDSFYQPLNNEINFYLGLQSYY